MKANKAETVEEINRELWNEAFNASPQYGTAKYGKRKTKALAKAKAELRQLLLAGVPEEMKLKEYKHTGFMTDTGLVAATHNLEAIAHNACRQLFIDYVNRITE